MTKQNIPKVRFVGFDEKWGQEKLGSKTGLITKGTTPKNQTANGTINFIKVENIADGKIFPTVKISAEEHESYLKRSILEEDDILFSIAGTLGRTAVVRKELLPANTNQALAILRGYDFNESFLLTSLAGKIVKEYIRKNPTVGAQPNISLKQVGDLPISFPSNTEQKKIGSLFTTIDSLLSSYKDNLENYQAFKKSMLSKMFPNAGQTVPEIRLDGFEEEWEEKNVSEQVDKILDYRGKSPKKFNKEWTSSGYLVLLALNVKEGYIDKQVDAKFADSELYNLWMGEEVLLKGDVLFTTEAPLGNVAQIPDDEQYVLNQRVIAFKTNVKKLDNNFLRYLLSRDNFQNYLSSLATGGTAKGIGTKEFIKIVQMFPKITEQRAIGSYFSNLDDLVSSYQAKIDELETLKKKLLQDMFI